MPRRLKWIGKAKRVFELELAPEFQDPNRPDLASAKFAALCSGVFAVRSARRRKAFPVLNEGRNVRVWFAVEEKTVLGFAIEVSYDGGRTFENPLLRYPPFRRASGQASP